MDGKAGLITASPRYLSYESVLFACRDGNEREITMIIKLILVRSRIRPVEITGRDHDVFSARSCRRTVDNTFWV